MTNPDMGADPGADPTTEETAPTPPDALAFVLDLRGGEPVREWSQAILDATAAAERTGKPATVSFTLKIATHKKLPDVVTVDPKVTTKLPERDRDPVVYFVDRRNGGHLTRDHPDQHAFPKAIVPGGERW